MEALLRLSKLVLGPPGNDFLSVLYEVGKQFLQAENLRLVSHKREHYDAERSVHLRMLVELVENHLGVFPAFHVNNEPYSFPVGFIPYVGDALYLLLPYELCNFLGQPRLVNLVGKLSDDYHFPVPFFLLFYEYPSPYPYYSAAGGVGGADVIATAYEPPSGKIRSRHDLNKPVHGDVGVAYLGHHGVKKLSQVMGRNIGRHSHRDSRGTV